MVSDSDAKANPPDKREHPRAVVKIEIEFKEDLDFIASYMLNISNGGLFIKTDEAFPLDTIVLLLFTMPGDPQPIETEGKVVWCNTKGGKGYFPKGMGIKFLQLNHDDAEKLKRFVEKNYAQIQSHSFL
ncbi:MAG: TIGR02266 family protein [Proteobacteria bacterium]|nr:TIGR02266 family protein [Pseudomonadota bacterium]